MKILKEFVIRNVFSRRRLNPLRIIFFTKTPHQCYLKAMSVESKNWRFHIGDSTYYSITFITDFLKNLLTWSTTEIWPLVKNSWKALTKKITLCIFESFIFTTMLKMNSRKIIEILITFQKLPLGCFQNFKEQFF